ncbi:MAG: hypothetical protein FJY29_03315 [Betaproteobacteria bacterium]|nr:hypothetical protein [Betaproteobacteria bacterium]
MLVFLHGFFAATLLAAVIADAFFVRSSSSRILQPEALVASWRRWLGLYQMLAVVVVASLGIVKWMPYAKGYPPHIFHAKMGLLVVLLAVAKIRMFKERRSGQPSEGLTRVMLAIVTVMFLLGLSYQSGVGL